ncbi:MAG: AraC family transcriptional regulator [Gemmatimonadales bacterium]
MQPFAHPRSQTPIPMDLLSISAPDRIWSSDRWLELSHCSVQRPFPVHFHPEIVVAVIVNGAELVISGGVEQIAETGSIVVFEPEQPHRNVPVGDRGVQYRGFYLDPTQLLCPDIVRLREHVIHDRDAARRLIELHRALEIVPSSGLVREATTAIAGVYLGLPRAAEMEPLREELRRIAAILRERCQERLPWSELARSVDISPAFLARRFAICFGVPPHTYQVQHRVAQAKRLIRERRPLSAVAIESGFADQSHFTHQFARYVGQTPGRFAAGQKNTRR